MREAANRLAHNLKTEGGSFEGKVSERVLGFIVYGEEVQAHYSVGVAIPNPGSDMVEEDVVQMYVINMGGDARRWARELAVSDFECLKYLDKFKDKLIERYLGKPSIP